MVDIICIADIQLTIFYSIIIIIIVFMKFFIKPNEKLYEQFFLELKEQVWYQIHSMTGPITEFTGLVSREKKVRLKLYLFVQHNFFIFYF